MRLVLAACWLLAGFPVDSAFGAEGAAPDRGVAPAPEPSLAGDPLERWHRVELGWVRSVQGDGRWGLLMRWVSELGPGPIQWAILAALFLGGHPRRAARMAVYVLLALWLRELMAMAIQSPRPYWLDPSLQAFGDVATRRATYSFPSGHAWVGTAFWLYAAAELRRPWAWVGAVALAASIAFSRVYLAVHYPSDVVAGMLLGTAYLVAFRLLAAPAFGALDRAGAGHQRAGILGGLALVALAMFAAGWAVRGLVESEPVPAAWAGYGMEARKVGVFALLGAGFLAVTTAMVLAGPREWGWLEAPRPWVRRVARIGVAAGVAYAIARATGEVSVKAWLPGLNGAGVWAVRLLVGLGPGAVVWWLLPRGWEAGQAGREGGEGAGQRTRRETIL